MSLVKVTGYESLYRDVNSRAILNTNRVEYDNYLKRKEAAESFRLEHDSQIKDIESLKDEINTINSELSDIKQLLLILVNK